ncbi:MAG TPA: toll/interleukin-1 receptor domain-containing protein [Candidatus Dormibacteraeota bacterium]|nr:toll/interleukin-1 receptor domain-containing protein [Candidatus Dormibacteraeota bacterium]
MQSKGARVWLATEDLKIGDKFRARIDEAIRMYDKLLLVLSKDSVKSPWVESEVEAAFEKEQKQKRTVLFPIRLDDAVMEAEEAWAADIRRTRHIGDFRKWKEHDEYQKAFGRLMRDLKAEVKMPG